MSSVSEPVAELCTVSLEIDTERFEVLSSKYNLLWCSTTEAYFVSVCTVERPPDSRGSACGCGRQDGDDTTSFARQLAGTILKLPCCPLQKLVQGLPWDGQGLVRRG